MGGWGERQVRGRYLRWKSERRASGTGLSLEGGLVRARPPEQRLAPPQSIRSQPPQPGDLPEPPSSAAARVAETRGGRVEPGSRGSFSQEESGERGPEDAWASRANCGSPGPFIAAWDGLLSPVSPAGGGGAGPGDPQTHVPRGGDAQTGPSAYSRGSHPWRPWRPAFSSLSGSAEVLADLDPL